MNPCQIVEDPADAKELLRRTALDIMLAGETAENAFHAAHGSRDSVAVLKLGEEITVYHLEGGTKAERVKRVENARQTILNGF